MRYENTCACFSARRDEQSVTLQMTQKICGMVRQRCEAAETEIITMSELPVQACVGCKTCFQEGFCSPPVWTQRASKMS